MSSTSDSPRGRKEQRPEFMAMLGLLPPYTLDDVKRAYLEKVRTAHPDHGGEIATFRLLQEAYEEAQRYLEFRSDKRTWIAAQMDRYVAIQELEGQLRSFGAEIEYQQHDWLQKSYGDFAELTSTVQAVRLQDSPNGRELAQLLVDEHAVLGGLKQLALIRCELTDTSVLAISCFQLLEYLDLSGNKRIRRVTTLAGAIPTLREFRLEGTSVGVFERMKLARLLRKRMAEPRLRF